jgi:uncharacterized protein with HEPN domain
MKNDCVFLNHILDEIKNINQFLENKSEDEFLKDIKLQYAVSRSLEIIGEASRNVSQEAKIKHVEVPWTKATGFRNRLVHEYFGIDYEEVWKTVTEDLPLLKTQIEKILEEK